jgi:hypothetical protein
MLLHRSRTQPCASVWLAVHLVALLGALCAGSASASGASGGWKLEMLHDAAQKAGAVCLDGTSPGYYIRPGIGPDAANFKIHFKGGGPLCTTLRAGISQRIP